MHFSTTILSNRCNILMHQLSLELTASNKSDGCGTKVKNVKIREALGAGFHGGTLVIADTKAQVVKACRGK
jgi:hypothetical protein